VTRESANFEVEDALVRAGVPSRAVLVGDAYYSIPTHEWISGPFANWFGQALTALGIRYENERHDCEDFARLCAWAASHCHAKTPGASESGLAFGELWIASHAHAINFAVHQGRGDDTLEVVCYEPQLDARGFSCRLYPMTRADFQTVIHARI